MTGPTASDNPYGIWREAIAELVSYRYLGCRSVLHEGFDAEGTMGIRSDLRHAGGLLAAPVAIAMLDTAGIAVDRHWQLALTHVEVNLLPVDVQRLNVRGSLARQARTQVFTEAVFTDADDSGRAVGSGSADWAVIADTPIGFDYIDPGDGVDDHDLPPLASAFDAQPRPDGGLRIADLTPRLGGAVLHHGPILVTLEAEAIRAAGPHARVESLGVRLIRAGKKPPFDAATTLVLQDGTTMLVHTELKQGDDSVVAKAVVRLHVTT